MANGNNGGPPPLINQYNQTKIGFYGEMGPGNNVRIKFLQTAVKSPELDKIALIEEIPGSSRWKVRDLFQRDVDHKRANGPLLTYLQDIKQVKFFNPLTLVLLPLDGDQVDSELALPVQTEVTEHDFLFKTYESPDLFKFKHCERSPAYSQVVYNDAKVKLVAIDGQHRLAALREWWRDVDRRRELLDWTIPVVVLGLFKDDSDEAGQGDPPNLLDVVRRTFVTINTKAEQIHDARKILLDDASINALCVQEIVESSHANDLKKLEDIDDTQIPLIILKWKGSPDTTTDRKNPFAIKTTTELLFLLENFLLDSDGSDRQKLVLGLQDENLTSDSLKNLTVPEDSRKVRDKFNAIVFPGISHLLRNFKPYKTYITLLREREREIMSPEGSAAERHALNRIKFGGRQGSDGGDVLQADIEDAEKELIGDMSDWRGEHVHYLIQKEIGMRAIFAAYTIIKKELDESGQSDWLTYSEWFVEALNIVYDQGWFQEFNNLEPHQVALLTHLAYEIHGTVGNDMMKAGPVENGFGSLLVLLILKTSPPEETLTWDDLWNDMSTNLEGPLHKGFRKKHMADLAHEPLTHAERTARAKEMAKASTKTYLLELENYLNG